MKKNKERFASKFKDEEGFVLKFRNELYEERFALMNFMKKDGKRFALKLLEELYES